MNLDQLNENKNSVHRTEMLWGVVNKFEAGDKKWLVLKFLIFAVTIHCVLQHFNAERLIKTSRIKPLNN
jgi:hypothetical protein